MCFYIGIEDLAANALIEIFTKRKTKFVTYRELEAYGEEVISILREKNEKAVLILSRERTNDMFRNYSNIFEEAKINDVLGIKLKENDVELLIKQFRGYLAWDVLLAFVNERSLARLGVSA